MIVKTGDILDDAEITGIVNPVNCHGVMGAGLARQIAKRWPTGTIRYRSWCRDGTLRPGGVILENTDAGWNGMWIVHLATKDHWRNPSRLEWIERGLTAVPYVLSDRRHRIANLGIAPIGCGLGGLDWAVVRPLVEQMADRLAVMGIATTLYESSWADSPHTRVSGKR